MVNKQRIFVYEQQNTVNQNPRKNPDLYTMRQYKLYRWLVPVFYLLNLLTDLIDDNSHFIASAVNELWLVSYLAVIIYYLFEYVIPGMNRQTIIRSCGWILLYIFAFSIGFYLWRALGITIGIFTILNFKTSIQERIGSLFGYGIGSVIVFGIARHIYNYIKLQQLSQQLKIESQQAELNYLKSQTNPHFLFNTLNNIYALAREKSDLAPESILRLSKILRYMLYETSAPHTAIEQELKIIADYIELEKLRYDDSLSVNISHDLDDPKQGVPPLLLIPLVENAFKHGVSETREHPRVNIHLTVKNKMLTFTVENSTGDLAADTSIKENIGLSNLRRQLTLLYTTFSLDVQAADYKFVAMLKINLNHHV